MTSTIDENGVSLDNFATIKSGILARFTAAFGSNFKTDDQSVSGVLASIMAEIVADQNDLIREAINARNPLTATGAHLGRLVEFNGISRRAPKYSTVALTVTANTAGCTIPAGSLVQDPANSAAEFATDSAVTVAPSATGSVSATATAAGAVAALAGTLTKIVNPVYGWASVTNGAAAVVGDSLETYTDLRSRRRMVSRRHGLQTLEAIYSVLSNIDSIGKFNIYENNTNLTDAYGQVGNSVWAICQGGADADIAEALYTSVSGGIRTFGGTTVTHYDSTMDRYFAISFSRVTEVATQVYLKIRKLSNFPPDGEDQIKQAFIDYYNGAFVLGDGETNNGFNIGETVEYFRLLTAISSIGGFSINTFTIGLSGGTLGTSDLLMGRDELAVLDASDIEIDAY